MKVKPSPKRGQVVVKLDRGDERIMAQSSAAAGPSPFRIKKILVPIDFSTCSKKALQYAVPFAQQFGAALHLLYVVQVSYYAGEFGTTDASLLEQELYANGAKELNTLAQREIGQRVPWQHSVRSGRTVTEIVQTAETEEVDLIIVSTHGHTGLKHVLLGSVAENIVRHAPCPVLIVREREHEFIQVQS
jgi:universal stress protein A